MNSVGICPLGGIDDLAYDKITFTGRCGANRVRLISHTRMEPAPIRFGIHGNGGDTHFSARANHPNCNFTAIRYEDLLKHPPPLPSLVHREWIR